MNKTTKIVAILLGVAVVAFVAVSIINSITKANEMAKYSEWDYEAERYKIPLLRLIYRFVPNTGSFSAKR